MIRDNLFTVAKTIYTDFTSSQDEFFNFDIIEPRAKLFLGLLDGTAEDVGLYENDNDSIFQHVVSFVACYKTAEAIFDSGMEFFRSKIAEENIHFVQLKDGQAMCTPPFINDEKKNAVIIINPFSDKPYEALISGVEFDSKACQLIYKVI